MKKGRPKWVALLLSSMTAELAALPETEPVDSHRATDCENIFSNARKCLIRLRRKNRRATDEH